MIAVLVAKIVGAVQRCTPPQGTGAPCNWYVTRCGARSSEPVLLPIAASSGCVAARADESAKLRGEDASGTR